MPGRLRLSAAGAALLVLAGCASVNIEQAVQQTNDAAPGFTQGKLALSRTAQQRQARSQLAAQLLARPLGLDDAVQLALANSPALQALIAQSWVELAAADQAGRVANPLFTFDRMRLDSELELGRLLSIGLLDLLTLPQRQAIARNQLAQGQIQLSASVVELVSQVRQAWVRAVAAQQTATYAAQVSKSAEAGAELARRMQQVGNFTRLQRARQQVFYADAAAPRRWCASSGSTTPRPRSCSCRSACRICRARCANRRRSRPQRCSSGSTCSWRGCNWSRPAGRRGWRS
jgi:hypothetical protein